ncbi:flagellar brake protein [Cytobacillus firmus]|uniref:flagellar brake protein n=1 Tax=Cytobacillus firmus TaxID=1399 RepID=UPI00077C3BF1|nr:flagellar brake domain-containing protein [Cytobacillus firmus]MBG9544537.1 pilus assembly protein PilZ [Cytobacillus firmus]MBG9551966.1 pilus assembly protein PilZ [Cytobacillus firmus]MBG9559310.1 pilus assembly protein PilZ [Cytobacillus firmus]MBG9573484.1 pilus assembly protein PilZ [Cytobacillus firmus]MDD9311168.1 flagellar brake domain-containing protein [Cytobacillus firmus]
MINIGEALMLELTYSEKPEKYKCKLAEREGNNLYIDYPINQETNKTAFLVDGTQLKATFLADDGTVYLFESEVLGRVKQNIPMMILSYPGDEHLVKIQRRQFVRVETPVDVAIHAENNEFSPFVSVTDDISAGGAAIIAKMDNSLKANMQILTYFVLAMQNGVNYYLKLKSKVIRVSEPRNGISHISVQFIDITPLDRQLLLRFCFDRQLAMKKKGLER